MAIRPAPPPQLPLRSRARVSRRSVPGGDPGPPASSDGGGGGSQISTVGGVVTRRSSPSPKARAPHRLGSDSQGRHCAPRGRLSQRASNTGQYLSSNESFIHGFRSVLGQKQRELAQQARFRLLHGSRSAAPQGAGRLPGAAHAQSRRHQGARRRKARPWREKARGSHGRK